MKEKKLIIFIPSVEGGGVEKNFFLVSNYLSQRFRNVSVITADKNIKSKLSKKIKLICPKSNSWSKKKRLIKYLICLYLLIISYLNNKKILVFSFQANAYAIIISKLFGLKIITRSNSSSTGWSRNFIKQYLYKIILNLSDQVIVNSYDFKKELDKKFFIDSKVIYNPLNKKEIIKKSKKKINFKFFKKDKFLKIINIARFTIQKDPMTLLRSINNIKKKIPIKLLIIGRGIKKEEMLKFIKKNHLKRIVKILPFQKNPFNFLKGADLFILTSKFEGLPNVLLEALCLKKFVISTKCPTGPKEILMNGKAGDLVPASDDKLISKKIIEFKKNRKIKKKKIIIGYKNLHRFDYKINMNKYYNLVKKFIYY